jgi:hypothetical protein
MKITLTKLEREEVQHKMSVLGDTPELQEDYNLTPELMKTLIASIPCSAFEWTIPDFAIEAVKGEMANHIDILLDQAYLMKHKPELFMEIPASELDRQIKENKVIAKGLIKKLEIENS